MKKIILLVCILCILCFSLITCISVENFDGSFSDSFSDIVSDIDNEDIKEWGEILKELAKGPEDITPEQEYYIGRSVGAVVLDRYRPYKNKKAHRYINTLGQLLSIFSGRPEIYGGYHFMILDSYEINAFATPSGLIFVTKGLLLLADSEDAVAAILAHEIAHITEKHGIRSIQQARMTAAVTGIVVDAADEIDVQAIDELTDTFAGSINDITTKLIVNGYSREFEKEADSGAVDILIRIRYDPRALVTVLKILDKSYSSGGLDFAKTHPDPVKRIAAVEKKIKKSFVSGHTVTPEQKLRFRAFYEEIQ